MSEISIEEAKEILYKLLKYGDVFFKIRKAIETILQNRDSLEKDVESWKKYANETDDKLTECSNKKCELEAELEQYKQKEKELEKEKHNAEQAYLKQDELLKKSQLQKLEMVNKNIALADKLKKDLEESAKEGQVFKCAYIQEIQEFMKGEVK